MSVTCYKHALDMPITTTCPQCDIEELRWSLKIMTELCLLKYGNTDKMIYSEILKAGDLVVKHDTRL